MARREHGFTLIELMVTIALIAVVSQIAMMNMGALIPATILKSETRKFVAHLDFLRSEARLQGKSYSLEVDMDNNRWRAILPPEDRLVADLTEQKKTVPVEWSPIDDRAKIAARAIVGQETQRSQSFLITFDENGFSADQSIVFTLRDDPELVWTINLRGLTGQSSIETNREGNPSLLEPTNEAAF